MILALLLAGARAAEPDALLAEGRARLAEGNYAAASTAFDAAIPAGVDHESVLVERAYLALAQGLDEHARVELRVAGKAASPRPTVANPIDPDVIEGESTADWMQALWSRKDTQDWAGARAALDAARLLGADAQTVELEYAYLDLAQGQREAACAHLAAVVSIAAEAPGDATRARADRAQAELAAMAAPPAVATGGVLNRLATENTAAWLLSAWAWRAEGETDRAIRALAAASRFGVAPEIVALERAYAEMARGHDDAALDALRVAAAAAEDRPADESIVEARERLVSAVPSPPASAPPSPALPPTTGGGGDKGWDIYGELYGWYRLSPDESADLVPFVYARKFWRPWPSLDLRPFVYANVSRDLGSRAVGPSGGPVIYADNTASLGVGAMWRVWQGRAGVFARIGPAINLLDDGPAPRSAEGVLQLDARVGAFVGLTDPRCRPDPVEGSHAGFSPCLEGYGEAVYVSRFDNNVVAVARGRAGATVLTTGDWAWQPMLEGTAYKDLNDDFWNNRAEIGLFHRWRYLGRWQFDASAGAWLGRWYGLENVDPAPSRLGYSELRLLAVGGTSF